MRIYKEEIFSPVLAVVRVPDYDSAVGLVNGHEFGNGTAGGGPRGRPARNHRDRRGEPSGSTRGPVARRRPRSIVAGLAPSCSAS